MENPMVMESLAKAFGCGKQTNPMKRIRDKTKGYTKNVLPFMDPLLVLVKIW
jgi:hypothetical protein